MPEPFGSLEVNFRIVPEYLRSLRRLDLAHFPFEVNDSARRAEIGEERAEGHYLQKAARSEATMSNWTVPLNSLDFAEKGP